MKNEKQKSNAWGAMAISAFLILFMAGQSQAATVTISSSTNWSSITSGTGGGLPTSADDVVLTSGAALTVDISGAVCHSVQIGDGSSDGTLTFSSSSASLTVSTSVQVSAGFGGDIVLSGGNLTCGTLAVGSGSPGFNFNTGTVTLTSSSFTIPSLFNHFHNLVITNSSASAISVTTTAATTISGDLTITHTAAGNSNLIMGADLSVSGSIGVSLSSGDGLSSGGAYTLTVTGSISGSGTLDLTNGVNLYLSGDLTSGFQGGSSTGSSVILQGSSQTIGTGGTITFNNLQIGNSTATEVIVDASDIVIDETLSGTSSAALDLGNYGSSVNKEMDLFGDMTGNFTLNPGSGIVFFQGQDAGSVARTQNIAAFNFFDVSVVDNAGIYLTGSITIADNIDFDGGFIYLGNYNITVDPGANGHGNNTYYGFGTGPIGMPVSDFTGAFDHTLDGFDGYAITNNGLSGGYFVMDVQTSTTFIPVGPAYAEYTPITLSTSSSVTQTAVRVEASLLDGGNPQNAVGDHAVNLTWDVKPTTGETYQIETQWGTGGNTNFNPNVNDELTNFSESAAYVSWRADQNAGTGWNPLPDATGAASSAAGSGEQYIAAGSTVNFPTSNHDYFVATGDHSSTALPVQLVSFGAQYVDGHVNLNWLTASEINNSHFDIERSADGHNWNTIGTVQGHGNSLVSNKYASVDNLAGITPAGNLYYRLKQVDFNGQFSYSAIRQVSLAGNAFQVATYPNPAGNQLNVTWTNADGGDATLKLVNLSGQTVYTEKVSGAGQMHKSLDISALPSGTYFVQIITAKDTTSTIVYKN